MAKNDLERSSTPGVHLRKAVTVSP